MHQLLNLSRISDSERENQFEIAHFIATEQLSFQKYSKVCELETRHGVTLGSAYLHENAAKEIIHYLATSYQQKLINVSSAPYVSLLLDSSTDKGNIDNEQLVGIATDGAAVKCCCWRVEGTS